MTLILELPFPPSVNHYYRHVVIHGSARTLISAEGRHYREAVALNVATMNGRDPLQGHLEMNIEFYPPDLRRRDLDNLLKALWDAMQKAAVYKDDRQIKKCCFEEISVCRPDGKVVVTITELQTKSPASK